MARNRKLEVIKRFQEQANKLSETLSKQNFNLFRIEALTKSLDDMKSLLDVRGINTETANAKDLPYDNALLLRSYISTQAELEKRKENYELSNAEVEHAMADLTKIFDEFETESQEEPQPETDSELGNE